MEKIKSLDNIKLSKGVTIVKFGAEWCSPCKQLDPILGEVSEESKYVSFFSVDIGDVAKDCTDLGIRTVPTVIKFKDGVAVDRRIGLTTKEEYKKWSQQTS